MRRLVQIVVVGVLLLGPMVLRAADAAEGGKLVAAQGGRVLLLRNGRALAIDVATGRLDPMAAAHVLAVDAEGGVALTAGENGPDQSVLELVRLKDGARLGEVRLPVHVVDAISVTVGGRRAEFFVVGVVSSSVKMRYFHVRAEGEALRAVPVDAADPIEAYRFGSLASGVTAEGRQWVSLSGVAAIPRLDAGGYKYKRAAGFAGNNDVVVIAFALDGSTKVAWPSYVGEARALAFAADGKSLALTTTSQEAGATTAVADVATGAMTPLGYVAKQGAASPLGNVPKQSDVLAVNRTFDLAIVAAAHGAVAPDGADVKLGDRDLAVVDKTGGVIVLGRIGVGVAVSALIDDRNFYCLAGREFYTGHRDSTGGAWKISHMTLD